MSHPAGLPELFIDRSLGWLRVPQGLRAAGLRLVTLAEHHGIPADENVNDTSVVLVVGQSVDQTAGVNDDQEVLDRTVTAESARHPGRRQP